MSDLSKFISEGMVEAHAKAFFGPGGLSGGLNEVHKQASRSALLAALEHAVKEGDAQAGFGWQSSFSGFENFEAQGNAKPWSSLHFPALILRGGKDGR